MCAYVNDSGRSQLLIEKFVKIHKCHRNVLDQDSTFLDHMLAIIDGHVAIMKEEETSLAAEKIEMEKQVEAGKGKAKRVNI